MYVEDGGGFEKERKWSDYKELKKKKFIFSEFCFPSLLPGFYLLRECEIFLNESVFLCLFLSSSKLFISNLFYHIINSHLQHLD